MKYRNRLMTSALGALALTATTACKAPEAPQAKPRTLPTAEVKTEELSLQGDASQLEAVGRVKNLKESTVSARVMGRVMSVRVKAGDTVRKGQVLMRLDDRDARGRADQARGALASATAAEQVAGQMLQRFESLRKQDATSRAKYDKATFDHENAKGAVIQARGALLTAQTFLKDTVVMAPFSGKVVDTLIEEGEMAAPGYPLIRLEGESNLEFEATVSGRDLGAISKGMTVQVFLDVGRGQPQEIAGSVSEVVPASDRITHSNVVRVALAETEGVRSGMFGRVRFSSIESSCEGLLVDKDRIFSRGQLQAVYIVDSSDRVRLRLVKAGRDVDSKTEILAGLAEGDRIVISDTSALIDGQPAKVQP